jgi:hypothetical protein
MVTPPAATTAWRIAGMSYLQVRQYTILMQCHAMLKTT